MQKARTMKAADKNMKCMPPMGVKAAMSETAPSTTKSANKNIVVSWFMVMFLSVLWRKPPQRKAPKRGEW